MIIIALPNDLLVSIAGWLIAAVPVISVFISNWFTLGASTYFRIVPAFCKASQSTFMIQNSVGMTIILVIVARCANEGRMASSLQITGFLAMLLSTVLIVKLHKESVRLLYILIALGWVLYLRMWHVLSSGKNLCDISHTLLKIGGVGLTPEEVLLEVFFLCVLFYIAGVAETAMRTDFLVSHDYKTIILYAFAEDRCLIGYIKSVEDDNGRTMVELDNTYRYSTLTEISDQLEWARIHRLRLDRRNAVLIPLDTL